MALAWMWPVFVLEQSYSGTLTAIIATPKIAAGIDSVEELVAQKDLPWVLDRGSALTDLAGNAEPGSTLRQLAHFMEFSSFTLYYKF